MTSYNKSSFLADALAPWDPSQEKAAKMQEIKELGDQLRSQEDTVAELKKGQSATRYNLQESNRSMSRRPPTFFFF